MVQTGLHTPLIPQRRPSAEAGRFYKVMSPRSGQTLYGVAVNDDVEGFLTHWFDNQCRPCVGRASGCEGCLKGQKARWKGFLGVVLVTNGTLCLWEITRNAVECCPDLSKEKPALAGRQCKLYRRGASPRSPVLFEVGSLAPKFVQPPPIDIQGALCRLWGITPVGGILSHSSLADVRSGEAVPLATEG